MLDLPNEPQPLNPGMLLTQKENPYTLPRDMYNERDILEYGPARWKRIQTLAKGFWDEWRRGYMYEIGKHRSKWVNAKRNAKIGDVVLIKDKNQTQLNWPTGVIVGVKLSEDGYVRSATVKPHRKPGCSITERERDRPTHDLVLLREVPQSEPNPSQPEPTVQENMVRSELSQ